MVSALSSWRLIHTTTGLRSVLVAARNQARSLCWRSVTSDQIPSEVLLYRRHNQFANLPLPDCDLRIRESLRKYNEEIGTGDILKHTEYVVRLSAQTYLEPQHGWGLYAPRYVIANSVPYPYSASPPSYLDYLAMRNGFRRCIHEQKVVSLRGVGEGNYYHCFNDVLAKLPLLRSCQVDEAIPLVISQSLYSRPFFQEMLSRGILGRRKWIVIGAEYVHADEILLCKALPLNKSYYDEILDLIRAPLPVRGRRRRVFLNRGTSAGRVIINLDQIMPILAKFHFEAIDTARLSLPEQMRLFSETGYVIGIHGAGLVNIIFRRDEKLSLLEIYPPNNIPPHYYWLSSIYGHRYDAMLGSIERGDPNSIPFTQKIPFRVDPVLFRERIEQLVSSC
jgi:hypothetical protein